jgi:hypothetical protein
LQLDVQHLEQELAKNVEISILSIVTTGDNWQFGKL